MSSYTRPSMQPYSSVSSSSSSSSTSSASSTSSFGLSMDIRPVASVEVLRCLRCHRHVETTSTDDLASTGMIREYASALTTGLCFKGPQGNTDNSLLRSTSQQISKRDLLFMAQRSIGDRVHMAGNSNTHILPAISDRLDLTPTTYQHNPMRTNWDHWDRHNDLYLYATVTYDTVQASYVQLHIYTCDLASHTYICSGLWLSSASQYDMRAQPADTVNTATHLPYQSGHVSIYAILTRIYHTGAEQARGYGLKKPNIRDLVSQVKPLKAELHKLHEPYIIILNKWS
ncbi:hypothetical protein GGS20DRAFT_583187 [Poronia punctata]|nr:hypothetical protein GGS20DRAFT_583187 [Poronia punctata]